MTTPATFKTADLCDEHSDHLQISPHGNFSHYGGHPRFHGEIVTLKLFEDNVLVREQVSSPGEHRVLVVDGGGSQRCALLGDILAGFAVDNQWAGIIINGCIRDALDIGEMPLGVYAMDTHPLKSIKKGQGELNIPVHFHGLNFNPGEFVYCDEDGVIISKTRLL